MRKSLGRLLLWWVVACISVPLAANEDHAPENMTVGVVDWRAALFQTKAARAVDQRMQKDNAALIGRVTELEQQIENSRRKLEKDQAIMSDEEIAAMRDNLAPLLREYDSITLQLREIQAQAETNFVISQRENIDKAMKTLATKYNLDFVLERQVVVYGRAARNITSELVEELDKLQ